MKKNSFVEGTIIATLAIVFTKILGMLYVIPFYAIIGSAGSSLYSYAYNIYVIFLNISSAGIPVAMSKLVSEFDTKKMKEAKVRSLKLGTIIIAVISIICFLILFIFARQVAVLIVGDLSGGNSLDSIALVLRVVSFSVLLIPFLSVTKGYLQGHKFITPTSTSQMIEQVVRIAVILIGSYIAIKILKKKVAIGVAVAVSGAFFGGLAAFIYILRKINQNKEKLDLDRELKPDKISNKEILKKILAYAIPFIIINVTVNFFNIVDMSLIIRTLGKMGFSGSDAEFVASAMTTWGYKLNMIVNAIATGLTISLIPNIVAANVAHEHKKVNNILNKAFQIVLFISTPAAIGLSFLAPSVWNIFYGASTLGPIIFKVSILTAIMCNVYLIALQTAQSLNEYKTVYAAVIFGFSMNAIFDVPFMYLCRATGLPPYYGATFATMLGYVVAIGIILIKLKQNKEINYLPTLKAGAKIFLSVAVMVVLLSLLKLVIPISNATKISSIIYVAIYAIVGALIYFGLTYKMGLVDSILGKRRLTQLLNRLTFGLVKVRGEKDDD